ncbi:MAG TPA: small basic protein [Planctomycetes bacterium]|nr:small basic protein [Planctomycetota bacterium]
MSIHKSLKTGSGMNRTRNVFTRYERLLKLKEQGRWTDDQSIYGLPKVGTRVAVVAKKKKKKEEKEEEKGKKKK